MKKNLWKHVLQIGVVLLITGFILKVFFGGEAADVEAYCPFGGLESLLTYLNSKTLACSMSMVQIMMGVVLAIGVILFSKLFCGYLCPLGTVSEWLSRLHGRLHIRTDIALGSPLDKGLRLIKYALLFWIFYMTISSSELFCKNFDPYYAVATGFKGEITLWMTVVSLALLVLGNLFVKMFWCKYVCPLGALSNLLKFTLTFLVLSVIAFLLVFLNVSVHWIWVLGLACVISYLYEIVYYKSKVFPLLRVTRDEALCTQCQLCSKRCPHQIRVADLKEVKHVDCTLCGECVAACTPKALSVNRRQAWRWLPAMLVVALFFLGVWLGNCWELPTIDERWGDPVRHVRLETFEQSGMRTIKCYGSSKAFAARMQEIPGVYGVKTFVKHHTVVVYYDPQEISREKVQEMMFTPIKRKLKDLPEGMKDLKVVTLGVDHLFDRLDIIFLGRILQEQEGFYGIVSEYACPVKVKLYMDVNNEIDEKELRKIVETPVLEIEGGDGMQKIECDYKFIYMTPVVDTIGRQSFLEMMFPVYSYKFEDNLAKYEEGVRTAVYELLYPGLEKPAMQRDIMCLGSFLSDQEGIVAYGTALRGETSVFRITYVADVLDDDAIWKILLTPKWTIHYTSGKSEEVDAAFSFSTPGATIPN